MKTRQLVLVAVLALAVCLTVQCWPEVFGFLSALGSAFVPIVVGLAFAFMGNIPMAAIERRYDRWLPSPRAQSFKRPVSLMLAIAFFVLTVALLLVLIVPQFAEAVVLLQQRIPEYLATVEEWVGPDLVDSISALLASSTGVTEGGFDTQKALDMLANAGGVVGDLFGSIVAFASSAVSLVMAALLSVSLLAEKETFHDFGLSLCHAYLGESRTKSLLHVLSTFDKTFHGFLVKQFADAVVLGVLVAVGMLLLGLPYASAAATLVGLCALVPLIGVYVGMLLGALLVFAAWPLGAVVFLVLAFVLVQVESSFISPYITESALGIPGVWVLVCITVFGAIWGILGILVGVPAFAAAYRLLQEDISRRD